VIRRATWNCYARLAIASEQAASVFTPIWSNGSELACPPAGRIAFRHRRTRYCHETWRGYVVDSDIVGPAGDNKAFDGNGGFCAGEVVACGKVVPDEVRLT
jgi:hypothetical protein